MSIHGNVYDRFFQIDAHFPRRCELTGRVGLTELHHIDARGMGGRGDSMDFIENIMCLVKPAHVFFGDIVMYKQWLKEVHERFMKDAIPFIHRKEESPFFDDFMKHYSPETKKIISFNDLYGQIEEEEKRERIKGYLYGHLAHVAFNFFNQTCGNPEYTNKNVTVEKLKPKFGFFEIDQISDEPKNLSIKTAPIKELSQFVENMYIFLYEQGAQPEPPKK